MASIEKEKQIRKAKRKRNQIKYKDYINWYKSTHPCISCGENDIHKLTFHHVNEKDKVCEVSHLIQSYKKLLQEIDKCVILCDRCHKEYHGHKGTKERLECLVNLLDYALQI